MPREIKNISDIPGDNSENTKTRPFTFRPQEYGQDTTKSWTTGNPKLDCLLRRGEEILWETIQGKRVDDDSLKGVVLLTDAGNFVSLDLRAKPGVSFTREDEQRYFADQGYADHVREIAPPDRTCNRLGYGFFGRRGGHIQDSETAEKILRDNYKRSNKAQVGDLVAIYDNSSMKIFCTGRVESLNKDGNVSEISTKWRDEGGIYVHGPDVQEKEYSRNPTTYKWEIKPKTSPNTWQVFRRNSHSETGHFKIIKSKISIKSIKDANTIFLGEEHIDKLHRKLNALLMDSIVKPGAILLVERSPAHQEINPKEHLLIQQLTTEAGIRVIGWDDIKLCTEASLLNSEAVKIYNEYAQAIKQKDNKKATDLDNQFSLNEDALQNIRKKRNQLLNNVYLEIRRDSPEAQIIILGGLNHFTENPYLQETLDKHPHPYIALKPTHTLPENERTERSQEFLS